MWRPCGFEESIAASASRCAGKSTYARDAPSLSTTHQPADGLSRALRYAATAKTANKNAKSVQAKFAVDRLDLSGLDQPRVRDRDRMQRSLQLLQPQIEEFVEFRGRPGTDRTPARCRSGEARDDPAGDKGCWRWSVRSPGAGDGNPATQRIPVSSFLSPSVPLERDGHPALTLVEHDLFGKPDSTFPDHALERMFRDSFLHCKPQN